MNNQWNENEFMTFLLLYASHIDAEYSEEEKAKIKTIASDETYQHILEIFNDQTDYQALQTILSYKGLYFPTADRKAEVLGRMKELFLADGEYNIIEKELLMFLDRLM